MFECTPPTVKGMLNFLVNLQSPMQLGSLDSRGFFFLVFGALNARGSEWVSMM